MTHSQKKPINTGFLAQACPGADVAGAGDELGAETQKSP
jgi:hypothetical protein